MSRLEEVEAEIISADGACHDGAWIGPESLRHLARTLAADVDELRGKLAIMEEDVCAAAGELLVPFPQPGSIDAKLLIANRLLKGEIAELRGKLDDVRMGIGCARGQRTTQYCAEVDARDAVIAELLDLIAPHVDEFGNRQWWQYKRPEQMCARACAIAGRAE